MNANFVYLILTAVRALKMAVVLNHQHQYHLHYHLHYHHLPQRNQRGNLQSNLLANQ